MFLLRKNLKCDCCAGDCQSTPKLNSNSLSFFPSTPLLYFILSDRGFLEENEKNHQNLQFKWNFRFVFNSKFFHGGRDVRQKEKEKDEKMKNGSLEDKDGGRGKDLPSSQ